MEQTTQEAQPQIKKDYKQRQVMVTFNDEEMKHINAVMQTGAWKNKSRYVREVYLLGLKKV